MKRVLIPLALAIALVVPVQAAAAHKKHPNTRQDYAGTILGTGSTFHFRVHYNRRTKRKIVSYFGYFGLPLNCADGPRTEFFFSVPGSSRVVNRHFSVTSDLYSVWGPAAPGGMHVTHSTLQIDGALSSGTIHRFGHIPHQSGDGSGIEPGSPADLAGLADGLGGPYCDSGVLNWTAHRA